MRSCPNNNTRPTLPRAGLVYTDDLFVYVTVMVMGPDCGLSFPAASASETVTEYVPGTDEIVASHWKAPFTETLEITVPPTYILMIFPGVVPFP